MMNAMPLLITWITSSREINSSKFVGVLGNLAGSGDGPAELKSSHRKEDVELLLVVIRCE